MKVRYKVEQLEDTMNRQTERAINVFKQAAEGTIEAGPQQQDRLEELQRRVEQGEFHTEISSAIFCVCVDGRRCGHVKGANSAGGTETLVVADDLTSKRFRGDNDSTLTAYENMLNFLRDSGLPTGGHTDDHASGELSGCGANDKLKLIYDYIVRHQDVVRNLTESLGIVISDNDHKTIVEHATQRTNFSHGAELLSALRKTSGDESVDGLRGPHSETIIVINSKHGTSLDRQAVEAAFGPMYQLFNLDAWALEANARAISLTEEEVQRKIIAMAYYNVATCGVLCGKNIQFSFVN